MSIDGCFAILKIMNISLKAFLIPLLFASTLSLQVTSAQQACPTTSPEKEICEAKLREELAKVEAEIAEKQNQIKETQAEAKTLKGDISVLNNKIDQSALKIKSHGIVINKITGEISTKESTIKQLDQKLDRQRAALAQILRRSEEIENTSLIEGALRKQALSDFVLQAEEYRSVQFAMKDTFEEVRETKEETKEVKESLETKKTEQEKLKIQQEVERKKAEQNKQVKAVVLKETQGKESVYQKDLKEKQAKAAEIRNALFALRDASAIKFGDALQYANEAFEVTGVRPAFILAILTQESNLGKNTGRCYLKSVDGSGVNTSGTTFKNVMSPTRDVPPYLEVAKELGFDPFERLISCPLNVGWGGAMGPAQFIPSTWALFQARIGAAVGKTVPDPWNPADAFMASSIYLGDLGANAKTYTAERNAACRYYSGRSCDAASPANSFYGNQVMVKAATIQETMIDPLQGL